MAGNLPFGASGRCLGWVSLGVGLGWTFVLWTGTYTVVAWFCLFSGGGFGVRVWVGRLGFLDGILNAG